MLSSDWDDVLHVVTPDVAFTKSKEAIVPCCRMCGSVGKLRCSACKAVYYCSEKHQIEHWNACHGYVCKMLKNPVRLPIEEKVQAQNTSNIGPLLAEAPAAVPPPAMDDRQKTSWLHDKIGPVTELIEVTLVAERKFDSPESLELAEATAELGDLVLRVNFQQEEQKPPLVVSTPIPAQAMSTIARILKAFVKLGLPERWRTFAAYAIDVLDRTIRWLPTYVTKGTLGDWIMWFASKVLQGMKFLMNKIVAHVRTIGIAVFEGAVVAIKTLGNAPVAAWNKGKEVVDQLNRVFYFLLEIPNIAQMAKGVAAEAISAMIPKTVKSVFAALNNVLKMGLQQFTLGFFALMRRLGIVTKKRDEVWLVEWLLKSQKYFVAAMRGLSRFIMTVATEIINYVAPWVYENTLNAVDAVVRKVGTKILGPGADEGRPAQITEILSLASQLHSNIQVMALGMSNDFYTNDELFPPKLKRALNESTEIGNKITDNRKVALTRLVETRTKKGVQFFLEYVNEVWKAQKLTAKVMRYKMMEDRSNPARKVNVAFYKPDPSTANSTSEVTVEDYKELLKWSRRLGYYATGMSEGEYIAEDKLTAEMLARDLYLLPFFGNLIENDQRRRKDYYARNPSALEAQAKEHFGRVKSALDGLDQQVTSVLKEHTLTNPLTPPKAAVTPPVDNAFGQMGIKQQLQIGNNEDDSSSGTIVLSERSPEQTLALFNASSGSMARMGKKELKAEIENTKQDMEIDVLQQELYDKRIEQYKNRLPFKTAIPDTSGKPPMQIVPVLLQARVGAFEDVDNEVSNSFMRGLELLRESDTTLGPYFSGAKVLYLSEIPDFKEGLLSPGFAMREDLRDQIGKVSDAYGQLISEVKSRVSEIKAEWESIIFWRSVFTVAISTAVMVSVTLFLTHRNTNMDIRKTAVGKMGQGYSVNDDTQANLMLVGTLTYEVRKALIRLLNNTPARKLLTRIMTPEQVATLHTFGKTQTESDLKESVLVTVIDQMHASVTAKTTLSLSAAQEMKESILFNVRTREEQAADSQAEVELAQSPVYERTLQEARDSARLELDKSESTRATILTQLGQNSIENGVNEWIRDVLRNGDSANVYKLFKLHGMDLGEVLARGGEQKIPDHNSAFLTHSNAGGFYTDEYRSSMVEMLSSFSFQRGWTTVGNKAAEFRNFAARNWSNAHADVVNKAVERYESLNFAAATTATVGERKSLLERITGYWTGSAKQNESENENKTAVEILKRAEGKQTDTERVRLTDRQTNLTAESRLILPQYTDNVRVYEKKTVKEPSSTLLGFTVTEKEVVKDVDIDLSKREFPINQELLPGVEVELGNGFFAKLSEDVKRGEQTESINLSRQKYNIMITEKISVQEKLREIKGRVSHFNDVFIDKRLEVQLIFDSGSLLMNFMYGTSAADTWMRAFVLSWTQWIRTTEFFRTSYAYLYPVPSEIFKMLDPKTIAFRAVANSGLLAPLWNVFSKMNGYVNELFATLFGYVGMAIGLGHVWTVSQMIIFLVTFVSNIWIKYSIKIAYRLRAEHARQATAGRDPMLILDEQMKDFLDAAYVESWADVGSTAVQSAVGFLNPWMGFLIELLKIAYITYSKNPHIKTTVARAMTLARNLVATSGTLAYNAAMSGQDIMGVTARKLIMGF